MCVVVVEDKRTPYFIFEEFYGLFQEVLSRCTRRARSKGWSEKGTHDKRSVILNSSQGVCLMTESK